MARPKRMTVDYFPHYVKGGKTLYILENRFGNDGYAFWFKVLEILGESEGHYYDCSDISNWEYLLAKTRVTDTQARDILKVLVNLNKIDTELWKKHKVIWCDNFVKNVTDVYRTRSTDVPTKPVFSSEKPEKAEKTEIKEDVFSEKTPVKEVISASENPKVKETKPKETKQKYPCEDIVAMWNSVCLSLPKVVKVTEARKKKIKCRIEEFGVKPDELQDFLMRLFQRVQASDFLTGRCNGKVGWVANFDWLFENPSNWVKVTEGNYDNNRGGVKHPTTASDGSQVQLGVGEFIDTSGRRTYGSGRATIPMTAPPRPSERYSWDEASKSWIML